MIRKAVIVCLHLAHTHFFGDTHVLRKMRKKVSATIYTETIPSNYNCSSSIYINCLHVIFISLATLYTHTSSINVSKFYTREIFYILMIYQLEKEVASHCSDIWIRILRHLSHPYLVIKNHQTQFGTTSNTSHYIHCKIRN